MAILNFDNLISQAAHDNRPDVVRMLAPVVFQVATHDELEILSRTLQNLHGSDVSDEILLCINEIAEPSAEACLAYIVKRLKNPCMSRDLLDKYVQRLDDAAGAAMLESLFMGEYALASAIRCACTNSFPANVEYVRGIQVNDYEVTLKAEGMPNHASAQDLIGCLNALADENNFLDPTDNAGALFWILDSRIMREAIEVLSQPFQGALPSITLGRVKNPELAAVLIERHDSAPPSLAHLFSYVPAWVDSFAIDEFPGIITFRKKTLTRWGRSDPIEGDIDYISLKHRQFEMAPSSSKREGIHALQSLILGLETNLPNSVVSQRFIRHIEHFVSDKALLGFLDERQVLGLVPISVIMQIPFDDLDFERLASATHFSSNHFPLDTLINAALADRKNAQFIPPRKGLSAQGPIDLLNKVLTSPHLLEILRVIPCELLKDAFESYGSVLKPQALIRAKAQLGWGFPDCARAPKLSAEALSMLAEDGYELWLDKSSARRRDVLIDRAEQNSQSYLDLMRLGGWPQGEPEHTIDSALKAVVRYKTPQPVALAYLMYSGPEAVAACARSPGEWRAFMTIFSPNQIHPHLNKLPKKFREEIFLSDIGL